MVFKSEFKGAIMNRGLVKFISLFIFDKEKKQAFRIKYDAIERLRQRLSNERGRINALEYNLGMLAFKVLPHICVDYLHGLNANQVSSLDEHKQNVEALKANLEEESLYNLNFLHTLILLNHLFHNYQYIKMLYLIFHRLLYLEAFLFFLVI